MPRVSFKYSGTYVISDIWPTSSSAVPKLRLRRSRARNGACGGRSRGADGAAATAGASVGSRQSDQKRKPKTKLIAPRPANDARQPARSTSDGATTAVTTPPIGNPG